MSQDYLEIAKYDALIVPHSNNPDELNLLWIYNYCDEDPIIMKNSLRAIYPFNEFAVYIHSDKKKELSNQIKGFMRKHGLLKDQRFSSFITFLYIFSINDFDFSDISKVFRVSDTIKKQFEMIDDPILATEQKVSIETRLKKWIAIESYFYKARFGKWRLFKIIAANFSEHLDIYTFRKGRKVDITGKIDLQTSGYGYRLAGVFKILYFLLDDPIFETIPKFIDVQYNYSKWEQYSGHPLHDTEFESLSITFNNIDQLIMGLLK